ncbi:MAG TPA: hypothetical protein VIP57_11605 [Candidatus Dormibacteraeota bacterium]
MSSPTPVVAAALSCKLPVVYQGNHVGWLTFPGGTFADDPKSVPGLQNHMPSFDSAIGIWVPVEPRFVGPDGTHFVDQGQTLDGPVYLVDARTGGRRLILSTEGPIRLQAWSVLKYESTGVYMTVIDYNRPEGIPGEAPGLWVLDPNTGHIALVEGKHYWRAVADGIAWGVDYTSASTNLIRLDLASGIVSRVYSSASFGLLSPTPDGDVVIGFEDQSGSPQLAIVGPSHPYSPLVLPSNFGAWWDGSLLAHPGVWIPGSQGVALFTNAEGLTMMASSPSGDPYYPVGGCY